MRTTTALAAVAFYVTLSQRLAFGAVELITNGDFSTPALAGWTVTDLSGGNGSWFASTVGTMTPLSGFGTSAVNGPGAAAVGGYAVSDQGGPGTHALTQGFTVPGAASSVILSFDMFVNDSDGGPIFHPAGLDHNSVPNQHARVDLLTALAGAFDTGAGVLDTFYLGADPQSTNPNAFTHYSFDITSLVGGGGAFQLRFAEVDNQGFFHQGVDTVSIQFTAATNGVVPEPLSLLVWGALTGVSALVIVRRNRG